MSPPWRSSVLAAGAVSVWLARRAGFWGFWVAAALQLAVLCVATAAFLPGASYIFLLTTIAAGLAALPCAVSVLDHAHLQRLGDRSGSAASRPHDLWRSASTAAIPLHVARQRGMAAVDVGDWLGPGHAAARCWRSRAAGCGSRIIAAAALVAAGGLVCTLCLPVYSAAWPERVNVEYWLDADTGQANYLARCDSSRLPATLAAAAHFDPVPRPRFAGGAAQAFYAAAPRLALADAGVAAGLAAVGGTRCRSAPAISSCMCARRAAHPRCSWSFRPARSVAEVGLVTAAGRGTSQDLPAAQRRNLVGHRGIAGGRRGPQLRCGRRSTGGGSSL